MDRHLRELIVQSIDGLTFRERDCSIRCAECNERMTPLRFESHYAFTHGKVYAESRRINGFTVYAKGLTKVGKSKLDYLQNWFDAARQAPPHTRG